MGYFFYTKSIVLLVLDNRKVLRQLIFEKIVTIKIKSFSFLAFLVVVSFISCKKDSSETPNVLTGNYKFIKLVASAVSAISYTEDGMVSKAVPIRNMSLKIIPAALPLTAEASGPQDFPTRLIQQQERIFMKMTNG
ncbi:MAG: hypothetical protein M9933_17850 [Chitinophagaceae bacterium]|nr:hypothetical protein [Chitinophagaceae bacterium]